MKNSTRRHYKTQPVLDLPLFNWRALAVRPSTVAGAFVARRYRVRPAFADLVAALAGIGPGAER